MVALLFMAGLGFVSTALLSYLFSVFTQNKEHMAFRISRVGSLAMTGLGLLSGVLGTLHGPDGTSLLLLAVILLPTLIGSWGATLMFWLGGPRKAASQREEIGLSPHHDEG